MTITVEQTTNVKEHRHEHITPEWHNVRLHRDTLAEIHKLGRFKESYSEVIDRVFSEKLGLQTPIDGGSF